MGGGRGNGRHCCPAGAGGRGDRQLPTEHGRDFSGPRTDDRRRSPGVCQTGTMRRPRRAGPRSRQRSRPPASGSSRPPAHRGLDGRARGWTGPRMSGAWRSWARASGPEPSVARPTCRLNRQGTLRCFAGADRQGPRPAPQRGAIMQTKMRPRMYGSSDRLADEAAGDAAPDRTAESSRGSGTRTPDAR